MDPKAMYRMTYGLFLLSTQWEGRDNACIINTAVQVANEPTRISISVLNGNHTCEMIKRSGVFNISAISTDAPFSLFQHFGMQSGRSVDKFAQFSDAARSANGLYRLSKYANMYLCAKVVSSMELGSHTLFVAEVTDGEVLSALPSASYAYYQAEIKPKPQQAAPSEKKRWVCTVCGYVYEGDSMPDDFECPLCHHGKEDFVLLEPEEDAAKAKS